MRECGRCGQHNTAKARYCNACGFLLVTALPDGTALDGGRYQIEDLLKQGGMGCVYRALDHRLGRPVALKEMLDLLYHTPEERTSASERFHAEARMLAALAHAYLPRVTNFFIESGRHYLAMDFVDGMDLEAYLQRYGAPGLPEGLVARWGVQIAEVLAYLHSQDPPIIYRDLKPSNIMVRPGSGGFPNCGDVVLVDFGIARRVHTDTASRTAVGTEGYAPLEQYQGRLDPRSDIYGLGATLYHLLTGIVPTPFKFPPIRRVRADVTEAMQLLLMRCLALEPEGRFPSAAQLLESLRMRTSRLDEDARRPDPGRAEPRPAAAASYKPTARIEPTEPPTPAPSFAPNAPAPVDAMRLATPAPIHVADPPNGAETWTPTPLSLPTTLPLGRPAPAILNGKTVAAVTRAPAVRPAPAAVVVKRSTPAWSAAHTPADTPLDAARTLSPVRTWRDGSSMVLIPAGDFWMGAAEGDALAEIDERPGRLVCVESVYLDRFPITNAQFERFVRETGYVTMAERRKSSRTWRDPAGRSYNYGRQLPSRPRIPTDTHPVVCVTWDDAQEYCRWAGKRLPSEAEWEKAARGRDGRLYPWGGQFDVDRCNSGQLARQELLSRMANIYANRGTLPVGCFPSGSSPYGLMDMAGNVAEWVSDAYAPYPGSIYTAEPGRESYKVVRGGSWWNNESGALRCSQRTGALMDAELPYRGFRCAANAL